MDGAADAARNLFARLRTGGSAVFHRGALRTADAGRNRQPAEGPQETGGRDRASLAQQLRGERSPNGYSGTKASQAAPARKVLAASRRLSAGMKVRSTA